MDIDQIVLVTKRTDFEQLVLTHASITQATFVLEKRGDDIKNYERDHRVYLGAIAAIRAKLPKNIPVELINQDRISLYPWRSRQLVIVCGPDGLFVNLAKFLTDQPVITVNPDPARIAGKIMIHSPEKVGEIVSAVLQDTAQRMPITLGRVTTNDGQELLAVNDFLVGRLDQRAARYSLSFEGKEERQCSSGIMVAAPMGATGQIKSIMDAVRALSGVEIAPWPLFGSWGQKKLAFLVREPFVSVGTGMSLLRGYVYGNSEMSGALIIRSEMPEGGVIFSDGMQDTHITFGAGIEATFGVAAHQIALVG